MKTQEQIKEFLQDLDDEELKQIWNDYCNANSYSDDFVYDMDEFDDIMSNSTPTDIVNRIFYGDFKPCHEYFSFNGYANLVSSDYLDDLIHISDLAEYIYNNQDEQSDYTELDEFLHEEDEEQGE